MKNIQRKTDGTYIIDYNGLSFHITKDYPCGDITIEKINEYISNGGKYEGYVDVIPEISVEYKIPALEKECMKYSSYVLAGIDVDINQQRLTNAMLEIEELKNNI